MLLEIHPDNPNPRKIQEVINCLESGGVIIYPTDTVYALGCSIHSKSAIESICKIKQIKVEKANFSLVCSDLSQITEYVKHFDKVIYKLLNRTLPGPYTYILNAGGMVPKLLRRNKKTVGIRVPDNNISKAIVSAMGHPIISSSLHLEDDIREYPSEAYQIEEEFGNLVNIVIDGGAGGLIPSTVIDCTTGNPALIREGKGSIDIL